MTLLNKFTLGLMLVVIVLGYDLYLEVFRGTCLKDKWHNFKLKMKWRKK